MKVHAQAPSTRRVVGRSFLKGSSNMSKELLSLILMLVMVINALSPNAFAGSGKASADLIVFGGTIVTMDATRRVIDNGAIAVTHGRIVAIGPSAEIEKNFQAHETVDANGRVII